jgi:flagellar biosynthetic protein FliQ
LAYLGQPQSFLVLFFKKERTFLLHHLDLVALLHTAMLTTLKLCTPLLMAPLVSGVATAIFQAVTQISDNTLSFLPKLIATMAAAYYTGPYLARTITDFMQACYAALVLAGGQ